MRLGFGLKARTRQRIAKAWDTMVGGATIMVIEHILLAIAVILVAIIHTARDEWLPKPQPDNGGWTRVLDLSLFGAQILLFATIIVSKGLELIGDLGGKTVDLVVRLIAGLRRIRAAWMGGVERQNPREK